MNHDSLSLITKTALLKFSKLSKKGKPKDSEWTVLSSVFLINEEKPSDFHIVSLATGTKCLDGDTRRRSLPGTLLHDSHAEVLARRGLIFWILGQIELESKGAKSNFISKCSDGKYEWIRKWRIGMLSTHLPCGDATIFVKPSEDGGDPSEPERKRRKLDMNSTGAKTVTCDENEEGDLNRTGAKIVTCDEAWGVDLNRTGAKIVTCDEAGEGDPGLPGLGYHRVGGLRTKPGRGERTLSLSCSDKILKWNILGIQGSLCSHLLRDSVYLDCFVIVGNTFNKSSLQRAFYHRVTMKKSDSMRVHVNEIYHVLGDFLYSKSEARATPSPDSVVWVEGGEAGLHEALTSGHKQGWSTKKLDNPKSWSSLCQRNLCRKFLTILECKLGLCYGELKASSPQHNLKKQIKFDLMKKWPMKGQSDFVINSL